MNKYKHFSKSKEFVRHRRVAKGCEKKKAFDALDEVRAFHGAAYIYKCKFCDKFHLTSGAFSTAAWIRRKKEEAEKKRAKRKRKKARMKQ